jgi:N-acetyl sugar amidotransferase
MLEFLDSEIPPLSDREFISLGRNLDIDEIYSLPAKVRYCTECVISNQRPRITFNEHGLCSACVYWRQKANDISWPGREAELWELCNRFRKLDGSFDVLVPSSGGKDSVYVAHLLKTKFNMHPLTMTWSPHVYTPIGLYNFFAQIHAGLDNILLSPNGPVHRRMCRISTIEMGDPFQPFIYGQTYVPLRIAAAHGISLIMDGENGEAEYGGDIASAGLRGFTADDAEKYWLSGFPLEFWREYGFTTGDLELYRPPSALEMQDRSIERHFFSYYTDWRPQQHYYYCVENTGFRPNPDGRSQATYSKYASLDDELDPYHYYFALLKFGLGRTTSDAAHEIREGLITREEAVALVNRFDAEDPSPHNRSVFLRYTGLTGEQLDNTLSMWRNRRLWRTSSDGETKLNFTAT